MHVWWWILSGAVDFGEAAFAGEIVGVGSGDAFGDGLAEFCEEVGPELREISAAVPEIHRLGREDMLSAAVDKGFVDQFRAVDFTVVGEI